MHQNKLMNETDVPFALIYIKLLRAAMDINEQGYGSGSDPLNGYCNELPILLSKEPIRSVHMCRLTMLVFWI
jgi:hypothetical protein